MHCCYVYNEWGRRGMEKPNLIILITSGSGVED
jgi:hypothetical protein